jgi:hypothetical protein
MGKNGGKNKTWRLLTEALATPASLDRFQSAEYNDVKDRAG